ncbi:Z1 domain-containing protein [Paenarthrobacter sp. MSM-2-10-13]|uniref:Z1 domain-containing protein n=1 Tax=Paenarthrobacter sp. MSM-2-10-13 TaxID=2717318 RepID=UPI00141F6D03|nr:Z1 domain-containing protein [Paenarthrobacter sp. MSM-2-10-13]NHW47122.1 Z1 domain-containing protein [Paenarthrobacter sp. MSM-2-10-13]
MRILERVLKLARVDLEDFQQDRALLTREDIESAVRDAHDFSVKRGLSAAHEDDLIEIVRQLEKEFNTYVGPSEGLYDPTDHEPWIAAKKSDIEWRFWDRYRRLMIEDEGRPGHIFDKSVGLVTDKILDSLEDPTKEGKWERRGLVAGQVQSGKTSNYVGLINKAIDSGYKLVIVLAGAHDSLRSQTQQRVNEGVLGFNTVDTFSNTGQSPKTGVGLKSGPFLRINCSTTVESNGDFSLRTAKQALQSLGGDPVILVVKKNASILSNVYRWATELTHTVDPETNKKIVQKLPLLVLDDEADYASVDTSQKKLIDEESDPSKINGLIRQILDTFEQSAYVAYTATPFANIFIDPKAEHSTVGNDLFPEHFIIRLPEPSNYSGPVRFFGLDEDTDIGLESVTPIPTLRTVDDHENWLHDGHKKTDVPEGELPESMQTAIQSFILSSAMKRLRKIRNKHSSMLIHVTRFKDVQEGVRVQVEDYVQELRQSVRHEDAGNAGSALFQLKKLYESDFISTNAEMLRQDESRSDSMEISPWYELVDAIASVLNEVEVQVVNGSVKDSLMYSSRPEGLTVIAVGGDKLSRGLTLEGLTTSYYLRASRMYDTLMQMGRWFGYRPGYLDLCRIFTTAQLVTWYERITNATAKLYREFDIMAQLNRTPRDFGLRVQQHPDGLMVTARNKSRNAQSLRVTFAATQCETLLFDTSETARISNWTAFDRLMQACEIGPRILEGSQVVHAEANVVIDFLNSYIAHRDTGRGLPKPLVDYIRQCLHLETPELENWVVMIGSRQGSGDDLLSTASGIKIRLFDRAPSPELENQMHESESGTVRQPRVTIKRLVSSGDELRPLDKDSEKWERALGWAQERFDAGEAKFRTSRPTRPSAAAERMVRHRNTGYLMIYPLNPEKLLHQNLLMESTTCDGKPTPLVGFAVSFPQSENDLAVEYQVNSVYWDAMFEDDDEVEESE